MFQFDLHALIIEKEACTYTNLPYIVTGLGLYFTTIGFHLEAELLPEIPLDSLKFRKEMSAGISPGISPGMSPETLPRVSPEI